MILGRPSAVFVLAMMVAGTACAQTSRVDEIEALRSAGTGYEPMSEADYEKLPLTPLTRAYVPEAIDLSERFPTPGNQNPIGSCLSWATAYAVRSYYATAEAGTNSRNDADWLASPSYLHNWLYWLNPATANKRACKDTGANFEVAFNFLHRYGGKSMSEYPHDRFCPVAQDAGPTETGRFRMDTFVRLSRPKSSQGAQSAPGDALVDLDRVKLALKDGNPVLAGMWTTPALSHLGRGDVYKDKAPSKSGPHAMVVVGYDDRRRAFRMLNSWGTDWADGGFAWFDYDTFAHNVGELIVMKPEGVKPLPALPTRPVSVATDSRKTLAGMCSQIDETPIGGGRKRFTGFVSTQPQQKALASLMDAGDENNVELRPWPICEAMLTLDEPIRRPDRPKIELDGGARALKVGERFAVTVTTPPVPTFLYLVYIEDDGTVVNLSPRSGPMRLQLEPGTVMHFGDGKQGRPTFKVTAPKGVGDDGKLRAVGDPERGHEAVIAIASRAPIDELEALEQPGSLVFARQAAKPAAASPLPDKLPPDRLFLSALRDIVLKRAAPDTLPREVTADILHLRISE